MTLTLTLALTLALTVTLTVALTLYPNHRPKVDVCVMVMCELLELGGIINNDMIINYTIIVNKVDAAIQNNAYMYKIAKYQ